MILKRSLPPILLLIPWVLFSQVDISGYADQSLFEVKPIIIGNDQRIELNGSKIQGYKTIFQPGLDLLQEGKLLEGNEFFKELSNQYPELPQPKYFVGLINFQLKIYKSAKIAFLEALGADPLYFQAKFMYGLCQIEQKEFEGATETMEELIQFPAFAAKGYYGLGLIQHNQPFPKNLDAYKMFEKTLVHDSLFLEAYIPLAVGYLTGWKAEKAMTTINKAISMYPQWQNAIATRAMISVYIDGDLDQFERDIDYLLARDSTNSYYLLFRTFLNIELGNYSQAVEDIRIAYNSLYATATEFQLVSILRVDPELLDILNYYHSNKSGINADGRSYIERGICEILKLHIALTKPAEPFIYLDSAKAITSSPTIDYLKANAHRITRNNRESIKAYSRLLEKDSSISLAYLWRADLYQKQGQHDLALKDYSTFIDLKKKEPSGYLLRGRLHYDLKNYKEAYADLSFITLITKYNNDILYKRAVCAFEINQFEHSNKDLELCIKKGVGDPQEIYFLKHQNHLQLGDSISSLVALDSSSFFAKGDERIHVELIEFANLLDSNRYVISGFERLIKYSYHKNEWYYQRGKWNYRQGNYQKAYFDLRLLVKDHEENGELCYYYGQTLSKLGYKEAIIWLRKAKKLGYKPPSG